MRVLVVEDDRKLSGLIRRGLVEAGMRVDVTHRGDDALARVEGGSYDAIVLDVMLPGLDGMEVCRELRARRVPTAILMLTARGDVNDRVDGLNSGADDYMPKPFSLKELAARLHALGRRGPLERSVVLTAGDLRYDPGSLQAWRGETEIDLSTTERALLETFMRHPGQVLEREQLLRTAWDGRQARSFNNVDVYVRYLRQKIDRPFGIVSIETIRGTGYRLRRDGGSPAA
jgi:two-component system OmpR family response regulator